MALCIPRIDACGKGLGAVWFSSGNGGAYPCGRTVRLYLSEMSGNFDDVTHQTIHIDFAGSTLKARAAKESPYGPFDPMVWDDCQSHPYITRSGYQFYIDAVAARIAGAWSSSAVLTVKASSYVSYNPSYSRTINWQAGINPWVSSDSPAPPSAISRTQLFNDDKACSATPADWGTVTIYEDGTISLANL